MQIGTAEISRIIKEQIQNYDKAVEVQEVGTVISTGDGIARIYGLDKVAAGELLEFPHGIYGVALNLEEDNVGAALFGETHMIKEGDTVKRTGRIAEVPVGQALVGRGGNPLGEGLGARGRGPDGCERAPPHRDQGARHRRAPAGERAAADRPQGDRRDDPD